MLIPLCISSLKVQKFSVFFPFPSTGGKHACARKGRFLLSDTNSQQITTKEF